MSQPMNAKERRGLTLLAESDLLVQCVDVNREWLRSLLIQRDRSRRAAIKCLADPNLSERLEKAARVAVVLSFGTASDRVRTRSLLRTHGTDSVELQSSLADTFGRIRHPAAAFLLLPMLNEVPQLVREVAFRSLLTLHHPMTSESLLAAIWADHGHLDSMLQVTQRLTQRECNEIFDSLEQASAHEPRLTSALQLVHSYLNARSFSSHAGHGFGCVIAAERLQKSISCDTEPDDLLEFMDSRSEWNYWQATTAKSILAEQHGELTLASIDDAAHCSGDVPPESEPYPSSFTDVSLEDSPCTAEKNTFWQNRLSYLARSGAGKKLTVVTSFLLAVGFGISKYQSSLQTAPQHQRVSEQPGILRVSEKPEAEPAIGLSAGSVTRPSSEESGRAEIEPKIRVSASSRQRD
jgi:hypothetical protein